MICDSPTRGHSNPTSCYSSVTLPDKALCLELTEPLPRTWYPLLWEWIQEHPEAHLDDTVTRELSAFVAEMTRRQGQGERSWGVWVDGAPAGAIGYAALSDRVGMLHGVCISRRVKGQGVADAALTAVLEQLGREGVRKVSASYFTDNAHIRACLKRLGFVDEGFLQDHTLRGGLPVSLWLVAKMVKG